MENIVAITAMGLAALLICALVCAILVDLYMTVQCGC